MTYLSRFEAQAVAAADRRHDDYEPAPLADQIASARHMIAVLGDIPELVNLEILETGVCGECDTAAHSRYRLGAFDLCRTCTLRRLHAATLVAHPVVRTAVHLESLEPPASLSLWAREAGRHISSHAVEEHLDVWDVHGEQREKLVRIAEHVRCSLVAKAAA